MAQPRNKLPQLGGGQQPLASKTTDLGRMNTEKRYQRTDFIFRKIVEEMILVPVKQNVAEMEADGELNK